VFSIAPIGKSAIWVFATAASNSGKVISNIVGYWTVFVETEFLLSCSEQSLFEPQKSAQN
jgi:hypothetical protein